MTALQTLIDQLVEEHGHCAVLQAVSQADRRKHPRTPGPKVVRPPQEGRIPIPDRPREGERWVNVIGDIVTITECDEYGHSFSYERQRPSWGPHGIEVHTVNGTISQNDILSGQAFRVPDLPPNVENDLEELSRNFQNGLGELVPFLQDKGSKFSIVEWVNGSWQATDVVCMDWTSTMDMWRRKMSRSRANLVVRVFNPKVME